MNRIFNWRIALIIAVALGSIIYLIPTFQYFYHVSQERPEDKAQLDAWLAKADQIRTKSIPLGLDIQGGTDLVLEVDVTETTARNLRNRQKDLIRLLDTENVNAEVTLPGNQQAIQVEVKDDEQRRRAANVIEKQYGDIFTGSADALARDGKATFALKSEVINADRTETMEGALKVIRERVNVFGLTQASVTKQGLDRIRVQIPGEKDPERVIRNIIKPAVLKFYLVHEENGRLVQELFENNGQIPEGKTTAALKPGAKLPPGFKALPGKAPGRPEPGEKALPRIMYIVRETEEMGGDHLENASVFFDQQDLRSPIKVSIAFDKEGARDFQQTTKQFVKRQLAIALDDVIYSAPTLQEEIAGGRAEISGDFTQEEAKDLSLVLKAGALPADLKPGQGRTVEATLGADSIAASMKALLLGTGIVAIFMILYYGTAGFIAVIALVLNVLIVMAIMRLSQATLTLSGIGGILLTIGMAVDANVLIYERMREELRAGKPMKLALASGFNKAFSVILDSNLTTLLTALVLLQFGAGSVQGFALTMTFGLIANLYTGLSVTYALCEAWFRWRGTLNLGKLQFLTNPTVKFIQMRYVTFAFSIILTVIAIGALSPWGNGKGYFGPRFAVDFTGGIMAEVILEKDLGASEIDRLLGENGVPGTSTQKFGDAAAEIDALIRVPLKNDDITLTKAELNRAMDASFGAGNYRIAGSNEMTAEIGQEFSNLALVVVASASVAILFYLWFRFELVFGVAAVIAMIHDLFITLGLITLMKIDLSLDVISAFLILLGYSVNDTIVIFDRIREQASEHTHDKDLLGMCNDSMNQCLSRTLITGLTTLFVMSVMYFMGGHSLRPFAITLVLGILFGTYSSIFVAAPIVYEWTIRRRGGRLALSKKVGTQETGRRARRGAQQPA